MLIVYWSVTLFTLLLLFFRQLLPGIPAFGERTAVLVVALGDVYLYNLIFSSDFGSFLSMTWRRTAAVLELVTKEIVRFLLDLPPIPSICSKV